jgi:hypothetical protein
MRGMILDDADDGHAESPARSSGGQEITDTVCAWWQFLAYVFALALRIHVASELTARQS